MTDSATVARDLRAIEDMALHLEARAIDRSNSRDIPGGDALVNLAPIAPPRQWADQLEYAERQADAALEFLKDAQPDLSHEDPDELWPASQLLTFWSEDYRQRLGMLYDGWRPTLVSEAKFLRNHDVAEWIWNNEVHWDDYAADVARAKSKLENILHAGERAERTAVVCDRCTDGRQLIRVYDDPEPVEWSCARCEWLVSLDAEDDHCPRCWSVSPPQPVMHSDPANDRWKCPGCKHQFPTEELEDARATHMRRTEPKEWIPRTHAIDLLRSMGHQGRTAAALASVPEAREWKHDVTKVRYVSWPDVWRAHLLALQTAKIRLEDAAKAKAHKAMCEKTHGDECWVPGRGCSIVCPRGSDCEWFMCPVHEPQTRASA